MRGASVWASLSASILLLTRPSRRTMTTPIPTSVEGWSRLQDEEAIRAMARLVHMAEGGSYAQRVDIFQSLLDRVQEASPGRGTIPLPPPSIPRLCLDTLVQWDLPLTLDLLEGEDLPPPFLEGLLGREVTTETDDPHPGASGLIPNTETTTAHQEGTGEDQDSPHVYQVTSLVLDSDTAQRRLALALVAGWLPYGSSAVTIPIPASLQGGVPRMRVLTVHHLRRLTTLAQALAWAEVQAIPLQEVLVATLPDPEVEH